MLRWINFGLLLTSFCALILVYAQKYHAEDLSVQVSTLEDEIAEKTQELSTLRADWAYLNQPGRLQPIVERHAAVLDLAPIKTEQYKTIEDIPMRPDGPDAEGLEVLLLSLEAGVDPNEMSELPTITPPERRP
ncbi:cell division protein FtsL [Maritalea mediterranea]|uniref:Cell division protein FtsL n=1 Tax=Maritalea mediterranea TaxID=2909667 RepID=A0ABS9E7S8_9HYPH|nr:hypothetical protein [Maritalea mediterranea]MCF4098935.1 hypothetical protein [Maritalea mediterranea]